MRKVTGSVAGGVVLLAAAALTAVPATADPTDNTTATFTVTAGTLDIVAPANAPIGAGGAPGTVINGTLGAVTVTDARASDDASWTATVTATDFTTGAGGASKVIPASEVDYWSGPATPTGNGTFTPGQINAAAKAPLDNDIDLTACTHAGGTGNNAATWNPTLSVNVPLANQEGTYTGTVTHSVA